MAALGWLLARFGGPALTLLGRDPSPTLLAAFVAAFAVGLVVEAWRWRLFVDGGAGRVPLGSLTAYRAAGHAVVGLIPSARLGGEPLRAYLLVRGGVPAARAIASVGVDRTIEMGTTAPFACLFGAVLVARGVPGLGGALAGVAVGAVALGAGIAVMIARLRRGAGVVSALATSTGLDRLRVVADRMEVVRGAEAIAAGLLADRRRVAAALAASLLAIGLVLLEYRLLLAAFGLPAGPLAVVAAIFATGAARSLPVPAGVAVLEGAQMWLFALLGHPPAVGLAVGLAVRLRELGWTLPGVVYLAARGLSGALRSAL